MPYNIIIYTVLFLFIKILYNFHIKLYSTLYLFFTYNQENHVIF